MACEAEKAAWDAANAAATSTIESEAEAKAALADASANADQATSAAVNTYQKYLECLRK